MYIAYPSPIGEQEARLETQQPHFFFTSDNTVQYNENAVPVRRSVSAKYEIVLHSQTKKSENEHVFFI